MPSDPKPQNYNEPKVVALGGGHGLAATLSALREVTSSLTAVVTVADNGGSSGRLREELGGLPPGDLRMALAALCDNADWGQTWAEILQHRFKSDGPLNGHALGNLLIAATWDQFDSPVVGLDFVGQLLGAQGRVLPMAGVALDIEADVHLFDRPEELTVVRGQVQVATVEGQVVSVRLSPPNPPAVPEAIAAVAEADWITFGPGSWFTSVMPHLLVPQLRDILIGTSARRVLVLNLPGSDAESAGLSPSDHLEVLAAHVADLRLDTVIVDSAVAASDPHVSAAAQALGADLHVAALARQPKSDQHDPVRLAGAFATVMDPPFSARA